MKKYCDDMFLFIGKSELKHLFLTGMSLKESQKSEIMENLDKI